MIFLKYFEKKNYKLDYNDGDIVSVLSIYILTSLCNYNLNKFTNIKSYFNEFKSFDVMNILSNILFNKFNDNILFNKFYEKYIKKDIKIKILYNIEYNNLNYVNNKLIINNNNFYLKTGILSFQNHVISVFICNNKYYLYDSNNEMYEYDWLYKKYNLTKNYNLYHNLINLITINNINLMYYLNLFINYLNNDILIDNLKYLIKLINKYYKLIKSYDNIINIFYQDIFYLNDFKFNKFEKSIDKELFTIYNNNITIKVNELIEKCIIVIKKLYENLPHNYKYELKNDIIEMILNVNINKIKTNEFISYIKNKEYHFNNINFNCKLDYLIYVKK